MLLQLGQLRGFVALLRRVVLALLRLAFAIDFLERPHLGKEHVAGRAADLAVGADVVGPDEIGEELIGLSAESFEREEMFERLLLVRGRRFAQHQADRLAARHGVGQAIRAKAKIVPGFGLERDLLERGHSLIALGRSQFQFGRAILEDVDEELRGHLVRPAFGIHQLQVVGLSGT